MTVKPGVGQQPPTHRIVRPRSQRLRQVAVLTAGPPAGILIGSLLSALMYHGGDLVHDGVSLAGALTGSVLAAATYLALSMDEVTELRPDGVLVQRVLRQPRLCPWNQITWISVRKTMGTRRVDLLGAFGRVTLPAPLHDRLFPNPNFDDDVATIITAWERQRSPWWQPPPWALPPPPAAPVGPGADITP